MKKKGERDEALRRPQFPLYSQKRIRFLGDREFGDQGEWDVVCDY